MSPTALAELQPNVLQDPSLAEEGGRVLEWTRLNMPLLAGLRAELAAERPLAGRRIGMCLHVEAKTAVLIEALRAGGAELVLTGSPATTDDRVAAVLARDEGIRVYARKADTMDDHHDHVRLASRSTSARTGAASREARIDCGNTSPTCPPGRAARRATAGSASSTPT